MKIAFLLLILLGLFLLFVALRSPDFHVERSVTLQASPAVLFEQANNPQKFTTWNPFMKLDPKVVNTYSGPEAGVGAVCSWEGNRDIGAGSATIIESRPYELVRLRMDWIRPMSGMATVDFTFKAKGDATVVTWAMYGKNNFMGKLMSLFMDCDEICGPQFERGLSKLGRLVQATSSK